MLRDGNEISVRVELVGACSSTVKDFPNILATAAFSVINSKWICLPDTVFPNVVDMYGCSETMRHLLFVDPFLWGGKLEALYFENKTVAWLHALPISDDEYQLAISEGLDKLTFLFEEQQIDTFNINRPSVI